MAMSLVIIFLTTIFMTTTFARVLNTKDMYDENIMSPYQEDYNYYNYDGKEYEVPEVPKKYESLLGKIIQMLQKADEEERMTNNLQGEREIILERPQVEKSSKKISSRSSRPAANLQRRGHGNGSVYWRCYFNAVTCFRKK